MEKGMDVPNLSMAVVFNFYLKTCERLLQEFVDKLKSLKVERHKAITDISHIWFTMMRLGTLFQIYLHNMDAAIKATKYGFTAVDRPGCFLVLAVASMGENVKEIITIPEGSDIEAKLVHFVASCTCLSQLESFMNKKYLFELGTSSNRVEPHFPNRSPAQFAGNGWWKSH